MNPQVAEEKAEIALKLVQDVEGLIRVAQDLPGLDDQSHVLVASHLMACNASEVICDVINALRHGDT